MGLLIMNSIRDQIKDACVNSIEIKFPKMLKSEAYEFACDIADNLGFDDEFSDYEFDLIDTFRIGVSFINLKQRFENIGE